MSKARKIINLHEENLLPHQYEFLSSYNKTVAMVGGIGSGKTFAFLHKVLFCLLNRPGRNGKANIGIAYPTRELGAKLFFYPFCTILDNIGIRYNTNVAELTIKTQHGNVSVKSGQYPERIVGETFTDIGIDELDALPMEKGLQTVRRMRERNRGRKDSHLFLVGTPEGFRALYEVLIREPNPDTKVFHANTYDNHHLPQGYVDELYNTYDNKMVQAYIRGKFVNLVGLTAHYAFDRKLHVKPVEFPEIGSAIHVGIDFNVNPLCACAGYYVGKKLRMFDEIYLNNSNTFMLADELDHRYRDKYATYLYPDPTGGSRKTSSSISDLEILARRGYQLNSRFGITQRHSLNITNGRIFHNLVDVDPRCKNLIVDLEQVVTDDAGHINKEKESHLTHMSDAFRNIVVINELEKKDKRSHVR